MKVLAFNSSPRMDEGNTALILDPFLEGMRGAGAEVELFYAKKLVVNPCQGEFGCWLKTPGECFQKDDMQMLYPKLREADVWVFATPVYVDAVSGPLKNLMDRLIPLLEPFFELRDGRCRHPLREGTKSGKVVLVSSCGFWEMESFDPLLVHVRALCASVGRAFAGALLRPHGPGLRIMKDGGMAADDVFDAAREAGRQLAADSEISPEMLNTVSRELVPLEIYVQATNRGYQQALDALQKEWLTPPPAEPPSDGHTKVDGA